MNYILEKRFTQPIDWLFDDCFQNVQLQIFKAYKERDNDSLSRIFILAKNYDIHSHSSYISDIYKHAAIKQMFICKSNGL